MNSEIDEMLKVNDDKIVCINSNSMEIKLIDWEKKYFEKNNLWLFEVRSLIEQSRLYGEKEALKQCQEILNKALKDRDIEILKEIKNRYYELISERNAIKDSGNIKEIWGFNCAINELEKLKQKLTNQTQKSNPLITLNITEEDFLLDEQQLTNQTPDTLRVECTNHS